MATNSDPRTVSREIAGVFEAALPRLVPGMVAHFNRSRFTIDGLVSAPEDLIRTSKLQRAMLFEIAVAVGEQLWSNATAPVNWDLCLATATSRQRRYYDAVVPKEVGDLDRQVALVIGTNLKLMLDFLSRKYDATVTLQPSVPGFHWIATGCADYECGSAIIEAKCGGRLFGAADYRQLLLYWLLSYISGREHSGSQWRTGVLINPRLGVLVELSLAETLSLLSAGIQTAEVAQVFESVIERHVTQ